MADLGEAGGQSGPGRRPGKSAAAFRTISEVADELDVPQHVLRFWETKFPQIRPLKRGGGRRYYRPEDVELLSRIRALLYQEGYTIRGVQRLLREGGLKTATGRPMAVASGEDQAEALGEEAGAAELEGAQADRGAGEAETAPVALSANARSVLEDILDELVQARQALPPRQG
ncbi:MAG: MerR family transcriptional regulator [Alphaproteobacteria bacterium]|nr:MerR family transcriptional regulator [Alphaproteobacteria bacterium]